MGKTTLPLKLLFFFLLFQATAGTLMASSGNAEITISGTPTHITCPGTETGSIQISISGGTSPYNYSWSGPNGFTSTSQDIANLKAGKYTLNVTDSSNPQQSAQAEFTITENDSEVPSITAPSNHIVNSDAGSCSATNVSLGTPNTNDNCGVAQVTSDAPASFPLGETTVTWTVTDNSGNTATAQQTITVEDNETPTITPPANKTVDTDAGSCSATNVPLGTPNTNDNCGVADVENDAPASFPIGNTTVTWTVTDNSGNTATAQQIITVEDNETPTITPPTNKTVDTDAGSCSAINVPLGTPNTNDNCGVADVENDAPASFPIGNTTVTWTVTDNAGNTATAQQTVIVEDNEAPTITPPANKTVDTDAGSCSATNVPLGTPNTNDNCGVADVTNDAPKSFPLGETTVTWTVTDNAGITTTAEQLITVEDNEAPIPPVLNNIDWGCTYTVETPTATDNCDTSVTVTADRSTIFETSGTITWTFTDASGNESTATQNVTIDPVKAVAETTDVLCKGFSTGAVTVSASGGLAPYTYNWDNLGTGATKTNLPAGTYHVTVTDANGCETAPLEISIEEPETFIEITEVTTTSGCYQQNNGTATITAVGGVGQYEYLWDNGQTTQTATGLSPGEHTVTITDENGCTKERTLTISTPTELVITGFLTTETISYGSATGTATVQVTGGNPNYTFLWSDGQTGQTARDLAAGTYSVTVTDASGCTATKEVVIIDSLYAEIVPVSVCDTEENIIRTSYFEINYGTAKGGTGPYTYEWDFGEGASPATATGPSSHKVTYEAIGDKTITVKVTDAQGRTFQSTIIQYVGGCFSDDCGSNDLTINDYFIGDANGNKITAENCSSAAQKYLYIYIPSSPKRYSLYVEYIYSIEDIETGEIINDKEASCFYNLEKIPDLARTFPINYECGNIVKVEGIYLTFQNNKTRECGTTQGNGNQPKCYSTNNEATVSVPLYGVAFPNALLCNGSANGIINTRASGGTAPYQYKLISSTSGETVRPFQPEFSFKSLDAGTYKVVIKDDTGLTFTTEAVEIEQPANPLTLTEISQTPLECYGETNATATVEATGGTAPYIYVWKNGQTTATATNLEAGEHTVRVIDANGCETEIIVSIVEPPQILAVAGPDQVLTCGVTSTKLQAEIAEGETGQWEFINGPSGWEIKDPTNPNTLFTGKSGTYTLQWSVACGGTDDVKITFSNCSTLDFDGEDDHISFGDNYGLSSGAFSIGVWVKPKSVDGVNTVLSKRDYNDMASGYDFNINNGYPTFRWNGNSISTVNKIGTHRWYHLAVTFDGGNLNLFVDGILLKTKSATNPGENQFPFLMGAMYDPTAPEIPQNLFHGWMEEVRIWNIALTTEQLHFMMNQRLENNGGTVKGEILPMNVPGNLSWDSLIGYYYMDNAQGGFTQGVAGTSSVQGKLKNITTMQERSAPLPYVLHTSGGKWYDKSTWKLPETLNGQTLSLRNVWDPPNSKGIDEKTKIDWNIAKISHNIYSEKNIMLLGLLSEDGIMDMKGSIPPNASGSGLTITHYLKLNGIIDLNGESQLVQSPGSILDGSGHIEIDQQGTASSFNYNYWSSPVLPSSAATNYSVGEVLFDGSTQGTNVFEPINFNFQYHWADHDKKKPIRISEYWLHAFYPSGSEDNANQYSAWRQIRASGKIKPGEGYSMKGSSYVSVNANEFQNYTFKGFPNNAVIKMRRLYPNQNYLIGNPYPSAIDARQFIYDNLSNEVGGNNIQNIFNGSLYFWDHFGGQSHYLKEYVGGYAVYNLAGAVRAISNDTRINANEEKGTKIPGQYIPVGQAFYVNTVLDPIFIEGENPTKVQGGEIEFNNGQRAYVTESDTDNDGDNVSVFHSQERKTKPKSTEDRKSSISDQRSKIWLIYHSPSGYHRQILVTADSTTTNGFDLGYDAPLIENNKEDMYWLMNNKEFIIQGIPDFNKEREIPFGIKTVEKGKFTIAIDELKNIPPNFEIYLKDSLTKIRYDLRKSDFMAKTDSIGVINTRYSLVFRDKKSVTIKEPELENTELEVFYTHFDHKINIKNPKLLPIKKAVLYNLTGEKLKVFGKIPLEKWVKLPVRQNTIGVYILKLVMEDGFVSVQFVME